MGKQSGGSLTSAAEANASVGNTSSTAGLVAATDTLSVTAGGGESSSPARKTVKRGRATNEYSDESTTGNPIRVVAPTPRMYPAAAQNQPNQLIFTPLGGIQNSVMFGVNLMLDTVTVNAGEDIVTKLVYYCVDGRGTGMGIKVMVLNASGLVSRATLSQPSYQGFLTFRGEWTIMSLTGVLTVDLCVGGEDCGVRQPTPSLSGNLTVSLAAFDLRRSVLLGSVTGSLTAASPVQVMIGRFEQRIYRPPAPAPAAAPHQSSSNSHYQFQSQFGGMMGQPGRSTNPFQNNPYGPIR